MSARTGGTDRGGPAVAALVELALGVPGVVGAKVRRQRGEAVVRLALEPGADAPGVADAVGQRLAVARAGAGAPDEGPPDEAPHHDVPRDEAPRDDGRPEEPPHVGAPHVEPAHVGAQPARVAPARPGRTPVPSLTAPSVASTPAPRWLGEPPAASRAVPPTTDDAPGPHGAPASHGVAGGRLELRRVRATSEGFSSLAEVVMALGPVVHAGVADAAATPGGTRRALAEAAARCLESAAAGRVRVEVDAVQVEVVAGEATALVALSIVSEAGHEQLRGAVLEAGDPHRAVVHAVLAAANRRLGVSVGGHPPPLARPLT